MKRSAARTQIIIASLLTLLLLAMAAVPASGAEVRRKHGAEDVAFRLVNCMRTGGYVTKTGKCKAAGSGKHSKYVKPLKRSAKISKRVSWPWAKRSAQFYGTRTCWIGHAKAGSTVDSRFASASLKRFKNGENMGCGLYSGSQVTVLRVVRMWQAEKAWRGPHWRQLKDSDFKSAGVGVAKYGARKTQLVVNFYGRLVD